MLFLNNYGFNGIDKLYGKFYKVRDRKSKWGR